jgi:peptidoglycan/LPS O-acetylase OafA/YrhL
VTRGFSLYLDLLRFGAAVVVLITHLAYAELSGGMLGYWRLVGNDAVMVFFVLSGFVIAHVVHEKEHTMHAYAISRLARLWSVAVPALAITILLDLWGRMLDPVAYSAWWFQASDPLHRIARALTFTNQLWFSSVRPFSNGPWWSLGYEAAYYAIFAALFYLRGARRIVVAGALMVVAGPKILLLFPVWLLGVWAWARTRQGPLPRRQALLAFWGSIGIYALLRASGGPVLLQAVTLAVMGQENVGHYLAFSDEFLSSAIIGPLVALHFLGAHGLAASIGARLEGWRGPILWFAQSTFAIYLLHYPMLRFAKAAFAYDETAPLAVAAVFIGTLGACVLIGPVIERSKTSWKRALGALTGWDRTASASTAAVR